MKHLSHYINDKQSAAFEKHGAFFCFSDKQFLDKAIRCVNYSSLGAGLVAPHVNGVALMEEIADITRAGVEEDIAENGLYNIVRRELDNHEFSYTRDISDTVDALALYPITEDQVARVARGGII